MEFLGYDFKNGALLEAALTTPSCKMDRPSVRDNQRLEFLGDAVLGFLAAELLYQESPREEEGKLTVRRTHMVSTAALCAAAERLSLESSLRRNRGAKPLAANSKTFADAIEAVIGAAYLDGGFAAARTVFATLELARYEHRTDGIANPKGDLQIAAQAMKPPRHPQYRVLKVEGRAHEPKFTVEVSVDGIGMATAVASNRQEAEALAARELLENTCK